MERTPDTPAATGGWPFCVLLLLGLFAWQGWMTLTLFGRDDGWSRMLDDQPVVSGEHPLHLYHGYLGAKNLRATGRSSCYDPTNYIGYPCTSVFDSGSRPAELFLLLAGGEYRPQAYKIGLAVMCLLVPLLLVLAACGFGAGPWTTVLATAAGLMVWWGEPGRLTLEAGEPELLIAALAGLAHAGMLVRYDAVPGPLAWSGLALTAALGWFAHPLLFALMLPLLLVYYVSVGARHPNLAWHLALPAAQAVGLGLNGLWLSDWFGHWWIRSPLPQREGSLPHRTFQTFWEAGIWGDAADRTLAVVLLASGLVGVTVWNYTQQRVKARLLGLASLALLVLALLGISWEPLGRVGTSGLLVPALLFAVIPAAHAWGQCFLLMGRLLGSPALAAVLVLAPVAAGAVFLHSQAVTLLERGAGTEPLQIGLGPEREQLVEQLREQTTAEARILWEDQALARTAPRWTALLAHLTGRPFIGGLDPDGTIEHSQSGLVKQLLAGKHITYWTDAALADYCRRYNVGWVVAWSDPAVARFRAWKGGASEVTRVRDGAEGVLFKVARPQTSYALKGKARLVKADSRHISLEDVVPEDGKVVLSLHYQAGMRASPSRVHVERETDPNDAIPFVRLRVSGPVARVTITWDDW